MPGLRRPALGKRLSVEDLRARGVDESFLVPEQLATETQFLPRAIAANVHPDEQAIDKAAMNRVSFISAGIQGGQRQAGKTKSEEKDIDESASTNDDDSDSSDGDSSSKLCDPSLTELAARELRGRQEAAGSSMNLKAPSTGVAARMPELSGLSMESRYGPGYRMLVAMGYQGGGQVPLSNVKRHAGMALQDDEECAMNEERRQSAKRRRTQQEREEAPNCEALSNSSSNSESEEDEEEEEAAESDPFYRVRKAVLTEVVQSRNQQLPLRALAKSKRVRKALTQHSDRLHVKVVGSRGLEDYVGNFVKASMPSCRLQRKASANWSKSLRTVSSGSAEELVVSLREEELWQESDGEASGDDAAGDHSSSNNNSGTGTARAPMNEGTLGGLYSGLYGDLYGDIGEVPLVTFASAPVAPAAMPSAALAEERPACTSGLVASGALSELEQAELFGAEEASEELTCKVPESVQQAVHAEEILGRAEEVQERISVEVEEQEEEREDEEQEEDLDEFTLECNRRGELSSKRSQWFCHGCRTPYCHRSDLRDHLLGRLLAKTTTDPTDLRSRYDGKHNDRGLMLQHSRRLTGGSGAASRFWCPLCGWLLIDGADGRPGQRIPLEALLEHLQSAPHAANGTRQDGRLAHQRSLSLLAELLVRPSPDETPKLARRGLPGVVAGTALHAEEAALPPKLRELLSVFDAGSSSEYLRIETAVLGPMEEDMFAA
mmetsp:Transcript_51338/g.111420  ORF Transcript_51338/g.111420 Transcript_51338/m.111420 type:complete len:720 (-) Transcript_51338:368-2527(-)|eukprot:CAMPEP_0206613708 /NCGR_PEP_ID=MMETSP0325_2-20121206/56893_1 /ASSEMBLY_ACC=CAM_ASM_000347 /TAXON_ID=2866 /ORGANISM="Crypthecodinium cohnii, Strain Seligo" /LENGTH=719 /DNA_ID=CAMNT_0054133937 /DNA_START=75 /DNA_END=2234 /DNA_ORIENTATION=+